jgi:hypothetical protein
MTSQFITYQGVQMSPDWPAKIRAAQHQTTLVIHGHVYDRIPYGAEARPSAVLPAPCRDCGVLVGQFHVHHCCIEACPRCGTGQRITCDVDGCPAERDV